MASTYTANIGVEKPGSGEQSGTWGTTTNNNFDIIDKASMGVAEISISGNTTLTTTDGTISQATASGSNGGFRAFIFTGTLGSAATITISPSDQEKVLLIKNSTSGGYALTIRQGNGTAGGSAGDGEVSIGNGKTAWVFTNGAGNNAKVHILNTGLDTDTSPQLAANLDVNGNSIVSTSNANVTIAPNGTGDVNLDTDTVKIGGSNENVTITTNGTGDLTLNTNTGSSSGSIAIADGANQNISLTPNGTGFVTAPKMAFTNATAGTTTIQIGASDDWTVEVGNFTVNGASKTDVLVFKHNGTRLFCIDTDGNFTAVGDVTASGSIAT